MSLLRAAVNLDTPASKVWPFFWTLVAAGFLTKAVLEGNFASAFGYVLVFALLGYWLINRAVTFKGVFIGYSVFVVFLFGTLTNEAFKSVAKIEKGIASSCLDTDNAKAANALVARSYCNCVARELRWRVQVEAGIAALTGRSGDDVLENPRVQASLTKSALMCAETIH